MLGKLLVSLLLPLVIVGCGCREGASSAAEDPPLVPAKRWRPDPPSSAQEVPEKEATENAAEHGDDQSPDGGGETVTAERDPANPEAEPARSDEGDSPADSDKEPGVITLSTGDWDDWPSYDMPLVIEIDVPEFPEKIMPPAPPIEAD